MAQQLSLEDYAAPFVGQLSDAHRLLRPAVETAAGLTGRPELEVVHGMLAAAEASIAQTLDLFDAEGGTDELRVLGLMAAAAPLKREAQRIGGLLEPLARQWDLYSRGDRGFFSGSDALALPNQDEILACAGELAALACVVLRPGDAAADALGRLSVCAAAGASAVRAAGRAAARLHPQMERMAEKSGRSFLMIYFGRTFERHVKALDPPAPTGLHNLQPPDWGSVLGGGEAGLSDLMNFHEMFQNEMRTTPYVNLLPHLACPAAAAFLRAACAAAGPANLPAGLAGWLPEGGAAELMQALDAAPAEELQAVLQFGLSASAAGGGGGGGGDGDVSSLRGLLADPAPTVFGAQALQAVQQATAFSFGAERSQAIVYVSQRIARVASYAFEAPAGMQQQFMQDLEGAFLPALRVVHSAFVSAGLLEDAGAADSISQVLSLLQDIVQTQQRFERSFAAAKRLGDVNGHFVAALQAAAETLEALSSRAGAAGAADQQAAAPSSGSSAAAGEDGSSVGTAGQAGAAWLEQCRSELLELGAANVASNDAIKQMLQRCRAQLDEAGLAEVRAAEQQALQRTEQVLCILERLCAGTGPAGPDGGSLEGTAGAVGAAAETGEGSGARASGAGASGRSSRPTIAQLSQEEPLQQKQMLGECLFPRVKALQPELAAKITGMLLEMDNIVLLLTLADPSRLKASVDQAVKVLEEAGWQP